MNDKQMLELAAKACDFELLDCTCKKERKNSVTGKHWNPLTDDGDALRLAVKLKMSLDLFDDFIVAGYTTNNNDCLQIEEPHENEPIPATRRAITRAAAEIGGRYE